MVGGRTGPSVLLRSGKLVQYEAEGKDDRDDLDRRDVVDVPGYIISL